MSINTELTALADAIRAKSGTSGKLSISGMTTAVNDIVINAGGDIDLSGVTVTADKMLSGIVAVGATGEKVTGNIQTVTATSDGEKVTVPVGYIAAEQSFDVGSDGYDTSAVTVTADTMLAGKIAVGKNGETITGTIPTVTASVSGDKVTVPVGYIAAEQTFDVGGGGSDVVYGYIDDNGEFQELNLSGDAPTISGTPVSCALKMFETGQAEPAYTSGGGGAFDLVKVTEYAEAPMVLKGVKVTGYSNGDWIFSSAEIELSGFDKEPKVYYVYAVVDNKLIGNPIDSALNIPVDGLIFYALLDGTSSTAETGQPLTAVGSIFYGNVDGKVCATFDGSQYIIASDVGFPTGTTARTLAFKFRKAESYSGDITMLSYGQANNNKRFSIGFSGDSFEIWGKNNTTNYGSICESERWYHCAVTLSGTQEQVYIDGVIAGTKQHSGLDTTLDEVCIGACSGDHSDRFVGSIADVMVYNRVLSAEEIQQLAKMI